ncbi:MAG: hypothetical protein ACLT2V_05935 [Escherichia coli]
MTTSPIITEMKVIPVAGHDSMLLNIGGAHNAVYPQYRGVNDNAGYTGVGEAPGGEVIYQTLLAAIPQVVGQEVARLNRVVQQAQRQSGGGFRHLGKGAWTFELKVNAVAALEAALLDLPARCLMCRSASCWARVSSVMPSPCWATCSISAIGRKPTLAIWTIRRAITNGTACATSRR